MAGEIEGLAWRLSLGYCRNVTGITSARALHEMQLITAERAESTSPARRNRAFLLLTTGSAVSLLGSRATMIAYPMLVLHLTSSPFAAGWAAFAAMAPSFLAYLPAGALVDRWDPRRTMLLSESGRGAAIATLALALLLSRPSVAFLISVAVGEQTLAVFSGLAEQRFIRLLVEPDQAPSAVASIEAKTHVAVLAGRPLGGFLFTLAPILPFLADVLSFAVSVSALAAIKCRSAIRFGEYVPWRPQRRYFTKDVIIGLHWLLHDKYARATTILSSGATFVAQALIIVFLVGEQAQHAPGIEVGAVLAASGLGGLLGSVAVLQLAAPAGMSLVQVQMLGCSAALAVLAATGGRSLVCMALVMAIFGFTGALANIEVYSYQMRHVPQDILARVMSIGQMSAFAAGAAGPVVGGILAQQCGPERAVGWLSAVAICLALFSVATPSLKVPENAPVYMGLISAAS